MNGKRGWNVEGKEEKMGKTVWEIKFVSFSVRQIDHLEDLRIDGRIILKLLLKNREERLWTGFVWMRLDFSDSN